MTEKEKKRLADGLLTLAVFRGVLEDRAVSSLVKYLLSDKSDAPKLYGEFVHSLSDSGFDFTERLKQAVFEDENEYVKRAAANRPIPPAMESNAKKELALLSSLTEEAGKIAESEDFPYVPEFTSEATDLAAEYAERLKNIDKFGYGIFASHSMFRLSADGIRPVESADCITLDKFVGYEEERKKIYENTLSFVKGKAAANALLFGDAGTGKSSTVKALVNKFSPEGLRLIEIRKDQLLRLSEVLDRIKDNPLKFIIFIDDLSFAGGDDNFGMLKAALEGSASARADNAVIYATSNRRHIVKESMSERNGGDDVHRNDTIQELMSLSDRFGLTVYFGKPDKSLYLKIVCSLADRAGIKIPKDQLETKAEAFALLKGGRSARAAEQFINGLI